MIAGLLVVAVLCAAMILYPFTLYPLVLRLLPPREPTPRTLREPGHGTGVSLLFCAFNEGAALTDKLTNIESLRLRYPDLEVLAYDDGSVDDTLDKLRARPDLVTVIAGDGRRGKAHGMKVLTARARGDILVFTDANVLLALDAIDNLLAWYASPEIGGVCGALHYVNQGESATATVGGLYWRLEERLKTLESRTGNVMGADGSVFSLRRSLYPDFPDSVLDDLTVSMAAVFAGARLIRADDVKAYERLVASSGDEFARKVRIAARAFHTHLHLRPQLARMRPLDRYKYVSHKLTRWFAGLFLVVGAASTVLCAVLVAPWLGATLVACGALLLLAGRRLQSGPLGLVAETVLALIATLVGVVRAVRGRTYITWSPATSR